MAANSYPVHIRMILLKLRLSMVWTSRQRNFWEMFVVCAYNLNWSVWYI